MKRRKIGFNSIENNLLDRSLEELKIISLSCGFSFTLRYKPRKSGNFNDEYKSPLCSYSSMLAPIIVLLKFPNANLKFCDGHSRKKEKSRKNYYQLDIQSLKVGRIKQESLFDIIQEHF